MRDLHLKKVANHLPAVFGQHALGMKLHALDGQRLVAHAHNDRRAVLVGRSGGDGEIGGKGIFFDDQGVVARAGQRRGESGKDAFSIVVYGTGFAVHQVLGTDNFAAEGFADRLVAEAYAQDGGLAGHVADERNQDPRFAGCAGTGGKQNAIRVQCFDVFHGELVVAADFNPGSKLAQVLDKVVGKRVVVVEDEDHVNFSVARRRSTTDTHGAILPINVNIWR